MTGQSPAAHIIAARRTPFARLDGQLAHLDAQTLAATVIAAVMADIGRDERVDDVILATATGPGGNLARRAALQAGCPPQVPGATLDRQCGGGLDAVTLACRLVESGAGELYIAGGTESASTSPLRAETAVDQGVRGRAFFPRRAFSGGDWDDPGMAESAETIAQEHAISRDAIDAYAARSHQRAAAAVAGGAFASEIAPCGDAREIVLDTCPRTNLTTERLARMPAVVHQGGTVTAGNSSQIADGAAAVVVASARVARRLGRGGLTHLDSAIVGVEPRLCGLGAIAAITRLVERNPHLRPAALTQVAMVEAFGSQMCATVRAFDLDPDRVNPHGGAIALGHPWGASGAAQVVRLFADLTTPGESGLAAAAVAGGMGTAAWFGRLEP